jgi:hypothetical protein
MVGCMNMNKDMVHSRNKAYSLAVPACHAGVVGAGAGVRFATACVKVHGGKCSGQHCVCMSSRQFWYLHVQKQWQLLT